MFHVAGYLFFSLIPVTARNWEQVDKIQPQLKGT